VKCSGNRVALRRKDFGVWQEKTWTEYGEQVRACGFGLINLGMKSGERVAILSEDRPEWFYADLATQCSGGVSVGIYATNSAEQCRYIAGHCEARVWFVEDQEQFDKAMQVRDQLPELCWIVVFDLVGYGKPFLTALIVLDEETVSHYAQTHSIPFANLADLARKPEIIRLIDVEVRKVNRNWSDREQIRDFRILRWELSSEDEELTPTLKVRRLFLCQKYADLIEGMYQKVEV